MDYWLAAFIGVVMGASFLAVAARLPSRIIAAQGVLALCAMLSIYIGAQLVSGDLTDILFETMVGGVFFGGTLIAMRRWLPAIGVAILLHGLYDAFIGPDTGVAEWYPPLCAGFDLIVGGGLIGVLTHKERMERANALSAY
ncbi:MAG: hypothetical protein AAGK17_10715 [Pseudomonadota bacterium]